MRFQLWPYRRYLAAICAGLLLAAAFPKPGLAGLAWLAPGLMLMVAWGQTDSQAFRIGYVAGLAHFLGALYWLLLIPFPAGAVAGWLALSAYLGLYPAIWVWLAWRWSPLTKALMLTIDNPDFVTGPFSTVRSDHFESWGRRQTWALTCAALWVALEMVRARFLTGFPWNLLGVSQCQLLSLIQISSLTGVYGISFLIVWSSVSLALAVMSLIRQPALRWAWSSELFLPLLALVAVLGFGFYRLSRPAPVEPTLKAALVQPSIPQTLIWDTTESTNRFRKLLQLSELALAAKPELLVWPESAVPNFLRYDPDLTYPAVTNLVQTHKVWLIVCADDVEPRSPQNHTDRDLFFNSSFLINPEGQFLAAYSKQRLVIFGEYVPLARWLPFLKWFTPVDEGFTPGTRPAPFVMPELQAKTSVLICFEDVFPHLARTYVEEDTDFLLNLTNDGWFRQSAAQWQHAANALFRAVENGLPLVRCANNGLTCWVDSAGRMHDVYFGNSPDIYGPGFKIVRLPRPAHGQKRPLTFYHYHGDLFGWFCVGWVMFRALLGMLPRSNKKGLVNKPVN